MEDVKNSPELIECDRLLRLLRSRQRQLGITDSRMAVRLGLDVSNYKLCIEGRSLMSLLRLIKLCNILGLDISFGFKMDFIEEE